MLEKCYVTWKYLRKLMCHFLFLALTVCTYIDNTDNLNHNCAADVLV